MDDLERLIKKLETDIEVTKKASLIAKPKLAEIAVESCLSCIKKLASELKNVN